MLRFRTLVIIALFLTLAPAAAWAGTYGHTYDFTEPDLIGTPEGTVVPEMPGTEPLLATPGAPIMPIRIAKILIPSNESVTAVKVKAQDYLALPGSHQVQHFKGFQPLSNPEPFVPAPRDESIYGNNAYYPSVSYVDQGTQRLAGYQVVLVQVNPVVYNPATGVVAYSPSMTVMVETAVARASAAGIMRLRNNSADMEKVLSLVDNGDTVSPASLMSAQTDRASTLSDRQYLIITSSTLAAAFQTLADYRATPAGGGFATHVETTANINAGFSGRDLAEKIRNYIIDSYQNHGTQYVLLGGDADGNGTIQVPTRGCYAVVGSNTETNIPSDFYYACLDGTWNNDNDSLWGESTDGVGGGDIDWLPEVNVGRITADSSAEAFNQINKLMAYESQPAPPFKTLLVGENLDSNPTWGGDRMDFLYTYMESMPKSVLYDRNGSWSKSSLVNLINGNAHDWINHLGHSNTTYNMKMGVGDVAALSNTQFFFIYTQGCYDGSFDNRYTSAGSYASTDSIAEYFTSETNNRAAYAFIGNSRYGWYNPGSYTDGASNRVHRYFIQQIFAGNITLGKANDLSKAQSDHSQGVYRWLSFELNLLGDPASTVRVPWFDEIPPVIGNLANESTPQGVPFTSQRPSLSGSPPVTWSLVAGPSGMTINSTTGMVSWDFPLADGSPYTVTLRATNAYGSDEKSYTLTVNLTPVNVALSKPSGQSSIRVAEGGPERGNDGNSNGDWYNGGTMTCTNDNPQAWWEIDLQGVYEISQIKVFNRTDGTNGARLTNFYLLASETPFASKSLNESLAQPGVWSQNVPGQCGTPTLFNLNGTRARYVRVQLVGTNRLHVAEMEVMAVIGPPEAPAIAAISAQTANVGVPYTGPAPSLTKGSSPITWSLVSGPAGMTIDPSTGVVSWAAPSQAGSPHTVTLRAANAQGSHEISFALTVEVAPVNVALNKPAEQSSIRVVEGGPEQANDGDTNGDWAGGSVTCTNDNPQAWWEVDLQGVYEISQIKAFNRTDSIYGARLTNFYVLASETPFASKSLSESLVQPGVWSQNVPGQCGSPTLFDLNGVRARYVRVQLVGTNRLHLAEVEVYGLPAAPEAPVMEDIAGQTAWLGTAYTGPAPQLTKGSAPITWSLAAGPAGMTIDASSGVVNWGSPATAGSPHTVTIRAANAQGSDEKSFALAVDVAPVNVALNKPAGQSSIRVADGGPERAVDGNTNGDWYNGGTMTCTNDNPQAWWEVDLQGVYEISQIKAFNRTDSIYGARLTNFYVLASETPFASKSLSESLAQPGVWSQNVPGQCGTPTLFNLNGVKARYVRVQLAGTNRLHLAELEVYGQLGAPEAPVISAISGQTAYVGTAYSGPAPQLIEGTNPITWSLVSGPAGMTIDAATGVVSWGSPATAGSPHTVTIRAANALGSDEKSFALAVDVAPVNVALNKPAEQSSIRVADGGPERAVDGNTNGDWYNGGTMTCTNDNPQAWWEVDLQGVYEISQIRAFNRTDSIYGARLTNFYLLASETPFASKSLSESLAQPGVWSQNVPGQCGTPTLFNLNGTRARYVRIQLVGTNRLHLAELEVYGQPGAPEAPVIGDISGQTAYEGTAYSGPAPQLIEGTNPITWSLVSGPAGMTIDASSGVVSWNSPSQAGSPHTVTIRAANALGSDEKSFTLAVEVAPVNVALNKPAEQSSLRVPEGGPEKGNDGDTNGDWYNGGSMTCTNDNPQAWWEVDLQGVYEINQIRAFNRTDSIYGARLTNFYVLASEAPFVSKSLSESLAQPGVWAQNVPGQCGTPTLLNPNGKRARYVRVQLVGTNRLHLAELEVMGLPVAPAAPRIGYMPAAPAMEGVPYESYPPVLSAGTPVLTWSLVNGPEGMTVDPVSGVVRWDNPTLEGSPFQVTMRVSNGLGSDEVSWELSVVEALPPTISAIADGTTREGQVYYGPQPTLVPAISPTGVEVPIGPVSWQLVEGPAGATIDNETGQVRWANPVVSDVPDVITIRVTSAGGSDDETYLLEVQEFNVGGVNAGLNAVRSLLLEEGKQK